jgi:hypothetical protein
MSQAILRHAPLAPAPGSPAFYVNRAEACLAAAAASHDLGARRLHQQECELWLMLARHRQAIEGVVRRYVDTPEAA